MRHWLYQYGSFSMKELKEKKIIQSDSEITKMDGLFVNGVKNIFFTGPAGERIELFDYTDGRKYEVK